MKKFVTGFIIGALLFGIIPTNAAIQEYILYKADYKVVINGIEYVNEELPILNYKGSTYAPFRSILEAAGLNVNWNAELGQAEVTGASEPMTMEEGGDMSDMQTYKENGYDVVVEDGVEYYPMKLILDNIRSNGYDIIYDNVTDACFLIKFNTTPSKC